MESAENSLLLPPHYWERRHDVLDLIRLAGASLLEANDEWLVTRRYLSPESLDPVREGASGPRTLEVVTLARR